MPAFQIIRPNGTRSNSGYDLDPDQGSPLNAHLNVDAGTIPLDAGFKDDWVESTGQSSTLVLDFDNLGTPPAGQIWKSCRLSLEGERVSGSLPNTWTETIFKIDYDNTIGSFASASAVEAGFTTTWQPVVNDFYSQAELDNSWLTVSFRSPQYVDDMKYYSFYIEFRSEFVDHAEGGAKLGGTADTADTSRVGFGGAIASPSSIVGGSQAIFGSGGVRLGGFIKIGIGGLVAGGSAESSLSFTYNEFGSGGLFASGSSDESETWIGRGGVDIAGAIGVTRASYSYNSANTDNDFQIGGTAFAFANFNLPSGGEVSVNGSSCLKAGYRYNGSGSINISGSLDIEITRENEQVFLFDIRSMQSTPAFPFEFNTGDIPLSHFRVVSQCMPDDVCDPVRNPNDPCARRTVATITAPTPADVCRQLSARGFSFPIVEFDRFSRSAENSQVALTGEICNELVPVDFCGVPECFPFCLNFDASLLIKPTITFDFTEDKSFEGGGVMAIRGTAVIKLTRNISVFDEISIGGIVSGGQSQPITNQNIYVANGGISIAGTVGGDGVKSSDYQYIGSGIVSVGGLADLKSSNFIAIGSGGFSISGGLSSEAEYVYEGSGGIGIVGSYGQNQDVGVVGLPDVGQMEIGGGLTPVDFKSSVYNYDNFGGTTGGVSIFSDFTTLNVISSAWSWFGSGDIAISGSAVVRAGFSYVADDTPVLIAGGFGQNFTYVGDGTLYMTTDPITPVFDTLAFSYEATGGIVIEDSGALIKFADLGIFEVGVVADFSIDVEVIFGAVNVGTILTSSDVIATSCGEGCINLPLEIDMKHNLLQSNKLTQFLARNGLAMASFSTLDYNVVNDCWQSNLHFKGIGNSGTIETWNIVFELQCSSFIAGTELGSSMMRFGISVTQKNLTTGEDFDTRVMSIFNPSAVCKKEVKLIFKLTIDSNLKSTFVEPEGVVQDTVVHDNIGLFKTEFWTENPDIIINVSEIGTELSSKTIDVSSFVNY